MRNHREPGNAAWFKEVSASAGGNLGDVIAWLASPPASSARPDKTLLSHHLPQLPFPSQTELEEAPTTAQCHRALNQVKGRARHSLCAQSTALLHRDLGQVLNLSKPHHYHL